MERDLRAIRLGDARWSVRVTRAGLPLLIRHPPTRRSPTRSQWTGWPHLVHAAGRSGPPFRGGHLSQALLEVQGATKIPCNPNVERRA